MKGVIKPIQVSIWTDSQQEENKGNILEIDQKKIFFSPNKSPKMKQELNNDPNETQENIKDKNQYQESQSLNSNPSPLINSNTLSVPTQPINNLNSPLKSPLKSPTKTKKTSLTKAESTDDISLNQNSKDWEKGSPGPSPGSSPGRRTSLISIKRKLTLTKLETPKIKMSIFNSKNQNTENQEAIKEDANIAQGSKFAELQEEGDIIGEGAHGVIKKVVERSTGKLLACKFIRSNDPEIISIAENEYKIMKKLSHPLIITAEAILIENNGVQLIMEYVPFQSLKSQVFKKKTITGCKYQVGKQIEKKAAFIVKKILEAVVQMHDKNICHRDLSMKNILISSDGNSIKIIDFGIAKELKKNKINKIHFGMPDKSPAMFTPIGTFNQMAPEMKELGPQTEKVDIWAIGILLNEMLTGKKKLMRTIEEFQKLSFFAKEFILKLLHPIPIARLSAKDALEIEWIEQMTKQDPKSTQILNWKRRRAFSHDDQSQIALKNEEELAKESALKKTKTVFFGKSKKFIEEKFI